MSDSASPWTAEYQAPLSFTISISVCWNSCPLSQWWPSNHLILCHPLLLFPSIFPRIRVFSNESALCIRWPRYQSFRFSISPSSEYSGLISVCTEWLDLLAVQGTLQELFAILSSRGPCFVTTLHYDTSVLGGPTTAWFIASLSYARLVTMTRLWSIKGEIFIQVMIIV